MKNNKATITDIADALGTSTVSVSRALSGQTGVSEELKIKILEKARELGYIKSKKSSEINVLILHLKPFNQDNSKFSNMVQGVEKALQEISADYSIEFISRDAHENLTLPYKLTKGINYDGVILLGRFSPDYARFIRQKIGNIIFFTGYSLSHDYDSVWFSFNHAGYKQCSYLIGKGHTEIGFIGNARSLRTKEKLLGISTALEDNGIQAVNEFILDAKDSNSDKLTELIDKKQLPTAFICEDDFKAIELIKLLGANGISVPGDISVIGSGNTDISSLISPALTTMDLNIDYACVAVVSTLLKRINNPGKPCENISVLSSFIERDSVRQINRT